jgi:hypothetical protein
MWSAKPPVFASETLWVATGQPTVPMKLSAVLLRDTIPPFPVPVSATLCGEPTTESLKDNVALRVPVDVGLNVTVAVQFAPFAKDVPQVVENPKSLACEPDSQILEIEKAVPPVFVSVTLFGALGVLTNCPLNVKAAPLRDTLGPVPVKPLPSRFTV